MIHICLLTFAIRGSSILSPIFTKIMLAGAVLFRCSCSIMDDDLASLRVELRRLRDRKRKRALREAPDASVTKSTWHTALCIGLLADYDFRASVCWLSTKIRRGVALPEHTDLDALLEKLREYFITADPDFLTALQDRDLTPLTQSQYCTAAKFATDYNLGKWVRTQNIEHGASVRTESLRQKYNENAALSQNAGLLLPKAGVDYSTGRNFACRWRLKHRAAYKALRTQEDITREQKHVKAST